jgi:hypothetical protein
MRKTLAVLVWLLPLAKVPQRPCSVLQTITNRQMVVRHNSAGGPKRCSPRKKKRKKRKKSHAVLIFSSLGPSPDASLLLPRSPCSHFIDRLANLWKRLRAHWPRPLFCSPFFFREMKKIVYFCITSMFVILFHENYYTKRRSETYKQISQKFPDSAHNGQRSVIPKNLLGMSSVLCLSQII